MPAKKFAPKNASALVGLLVVILILGGLVYFYSNPLPLPTSLQFIEKEKVDAIDTGEKFITDNLADSRDLRRRSDLEVIYKGLFQYATENGKYPTLPEVETCIGTSEECVNLAASLVPNNIAAIPVDPTKGTQENTGYFIHQENRRVYLKAYGELNKEIVIEK